MAVKIDLVLKPSKRLVSLLGCIHTSRNNSGSSGSLELYKTLLDIRPGIFLVEAPKKSVDLSKFVWDTRDPVLTPEMFCEEEGEFVETAAFAAAHSLGVDGCIFPIDLDSFKIRRMLAFRMLLHPIESLRILSKYHGEVTPGMSLDDIRIWRSRFQTLCPTAYSILFTHREIYMRDQILSHINSPNKEPIAVMLGMSHLEAVYELLLDSV